jgi:hypothetical protein
VFGPVSKALIVISAAARFPPCVWSVTTPTRRLRADGLGVMLSANELGDVADWYLLPKGDIRSSYALEVAANKYTELPRHRSPSSKGTASQILAPIACDWRRSSKSFARTNKSGPGAFGLSGLGGPTCPNWILKAAVGDWRPKRNQVSY